MEEIELIVGNSNRRFSGVTASMLSTLPGIAHRIKLAVLGSHFIPDSIPTLSYREFLSTCRKPLPHGGQRVFHARRNNEMIQALIAKNFFGAKIRIVFTSTAQRNHSWLTRYLIGQMDGIVTTCQAAASYLIQKPSIVVPHGVNTETYHPAPCKVDAWESLGYPGKYGIGIFGRIREQKGVDLFVEAALLIAEKHPDFTFIIGGEVTPSNARFVRGLKQKIEKAGLEERILFIGKQPLNRLPLLFRGVSILAALSRNEGFGLTPLEAMASGTAVICSGAGAWPEIIHQGQEGYCMDNPTPIAIAQKMDELMSDPEKIAVMGHRGRKLVEASYTIDREAAQLAAYLATHVKDRSA